MTTEELRGRVFRTARLARRPRRPRGRTRWRLVISVAGETSRRSLSSTQGLVTPVQPAPRLRCVYLKEPGDGAQTRLRSTGWNTSGAAKLLKWTGGIARRSNDDHVFRVNDPPGRSVRGGLRRSGVRAEAFARHLGVPYVFCHLSRYCVLAAEMPFAYL